MVAVTDDSATSESTHTGSVDGGDVVFIVYDPLYVVVDPWVANMMIASRTSSLFDARHASSFEREVQLAARFISLLLRYVLISDG
ncbi:unnamed protein product [Toxocara canis]|uniref:Creatinase_N domain-containing protein n=1 Tax=Toxocara canis TaxID=6265 RepID=A0A183V117_TOXCA|nr:unnamed protein product [Toxocara canis]